MSGSEQGLEGLSQQSLENLAIGKTKKEEADAAFKAGNIKDALRHYHEALLYLRGLNKSSPMQKEGENTDGKPKNEIEEIQVKIYSNMSACHMKNSNWHRTIETADKALALDKDNIKARFRKAKALGETGYFEKAEAIMNELLEKHPSSPDVPAIKAELEAQRTKDKERERKHNKKMRGFLSREPAIFDTEPSSTTTSSSAAPSAKIEEVVESA